MTPPRGVEDAASYNTNLKQIQLRVQVHRFAHGKVIRGLRQVVQQKFQHNRAAQAPALNFKVREPHRQVSVADITHADKRGACHRAGEAVSLARVGRGAAVFWAGQAEIFALYDL